MQFLIVLSAALALASAAPGYLGAGYVGAPAIAGPYASGILTPSGDTIEVAAAKADHFQAHANARAGLVAHGVAAYGVPAVAAYGAYGAPVVAGPYASGPYASGILTPSGDTIEVAAAKANHFQAHVDAKAGLVAHGVAAYGAPGIAAYGVPAVAAYGAHGIAAYGTTHLVDPVAIAAGAPLPVGDTVEVAAAKAAHFQAHVDAKHGLLGRKKRSPGYLGAGALGYAAPIHSYGYSAVGAYASPLAYGAHGYLY